MYERDEYYEREYTIEIGIIACWKKVVAMRKIFVLKLVENRSADRNKIQ